MIIEMEYRGLLKIISGGQCGADLGGLQAARRRGIETGGWCPKGWRTELGPNPSLAEYGLKEDASTSYVPRTRLNVQEADGTLIVASNFNSPGTVLTIESCRKYSKPYFKVFPSDISNQMEFDVIMESIEEWVKTNNISILNVAGNRDDFYSAEHRESAEIIVLNLIDRLATQKLNTSRE